MRLPFLRPKTDPAPTPSRGRRPPEPVGDVELARTRARRRLMGAGVLLALGVVSFPLVFENEPRPLPMDIPIVLPAGTAPAPAAPPRGGRPLPVLSVPAEAGNEVAQRAPAAADPAPPPAAASVPAATAAPAPAPRVAAAPVTVPEVAPAASSAAARAAPAGPPRAVPAGAVRVPPSDSASAAAAAASASGRYVVQVGAYTDGPTLRATRERVEKLGLKTYTQVIETAAGKRTRVRLGPYASRSEADAAAARLKRAGLPANILAL